MPARRSARCVLALAAGSALSWCPPAFAGITTDGSLGAARSFTGSTVNLPASLGRQKGGNVFQSFSQFDIAPGQKATFTAAGATAPVKNVLARVTGGRASQINGQLGCNIPGANLYLINPAGLTFGHGSSLNVSGTFTATTADVMRLADGKAFAVDRVGDGILTSAAPAGFGFLSARPGVISLDDTSLSAPAARVAGGSVTMSMATLACPAGHLSVAAMTNGALAIDAHRGDLVPAGVGTGGAITLNASVLSTDGADGGRLDVRAASIRMDRSSVFGRTFGSPAARGVRITASNALLATDSAIDASTSGPGRAGDISVRAGRVRFDQIDDSLAAVGLVSRSEATALGASGTINIRSDVLELLDGGFASTTSRGVAAASDITVRTNELRAGGRANSGLFASSNSTGVGGHGGNIRVAAGQVDLYNGGQFAASTFGSGDAGTVAVDATQINIDGRGNGNVITGITSNTGTGSTGRAGSVNVSADQLRLQSGGEIGSSTHGQGAAGTVSVRANTLVLNGNGNATPVTAIVSNTLAESTGTGGSVHIDAGLLHILNGGDIGCTTFGQGDAGDVTVRADDLTVDGAAVPKLFTGIASDSGPKAAGAGGDVGVVAQRLRLRAGGVIAADTFGVGHGGAVSVRAGSLSVDAAADPDAISAISSAANAAGDAGTVSVRADDILLKDYGRITSSTSGAGNAGAVMIRARHLTADSANGDYYDDASGTTGILSESTGGAASGNGGNVVVSADRLRLVNGGEIAADVDGNGHGGDITVAAIVLQVSGEDSVGASGGISSIAYPKHGTTSFQGRAGDVTVSADRLTLNEGYLETGTSDFGNAGRVRVKASHLVLVDEADISSDAGPADLIEPSGAAGSVVVVSHDLSLTRGSFISSDTRGTGEAGRVVIRSRDIRLSDPPQENAAGAISAVTSARHHGGSGGTIDVRANTLALDNGAIVTAQSSGDGAAGDVHIRVGDVTLEHRAAIQSISRSTGPAGGVTVDCDDLRLTTRSFLGASARAAAGGDLTVTATDAIGLRASTIATLSQTSDSGNLTLNAGHLISLFDATVTAQAGKDGAKLLLDPLVVTLNHSTINGLAAKVEVPVVIDTSAILIKSPDSQILSDNPILPPDLDLTGAILHFVVPNFGQQTVLADGCGEQLRKRNLSSFTAQERLGTPPVAGAAVMSAPMPSPSRRAAPAR